MRAHVALGIALAILGACAPTLEGDGFYRCGRTGRCPPSAPYCDPGGFCRVAPPSADAGSDSGDDAGWAEPYVDCTDTCAAPGECDALTIDGIGTAGYCTRPCTMDSECPPYRGALSACGPAGRCVRGCTGESDCPAPFECISGRWSSGGTLSSACGGIALYAPLSQYENCATDDNCERPLECIHGRCLRHCGPTAPSCSEIEYCDTTPADGAVCLFACDGAPEICADSFETVCDVRVCRPTSW